MSIDFDMNIEPSVEEDISSLDSFHNSENTVMNTNTIEVVDQPTTIKEIDLEEKMCFGTARDYYHRYPEKIGFVVKIGSVVKIKNTNWEKKNDDR
ncbi:hypothetical protein PIB30_075724, partial [Stylosanthes scabra]|nr:hypothetical protein [Stylosanthes scabra]